MFYSSFVDIACILYCLYVLQDNTKKGTDDYDRAHKLSMPLDVLVTNTNFVTKVAALDLAIDETTIAFGGCGDFVYNLMGK